MGSARLGWEVRGWDGRRWVGAGVGVEGRGRRKGRPRAACTHMVRADLKVDDAALDFILHLWHTGRLEEAAHAPHIDLAVLVDGRRAQLAERQRAQRRLRRLLALRGALRPAGREMRHRHGQRLLLRIERLASVEEAHDLVAELPVLVTPPGVRHAIGREAARVCVACEGDAHRRGHVVALLDACRLQAVGCIAVTEACACAYVAARRRRVSRVHRAHGPLSAGTEEEGGGGERGRARRRGEAGTGRARMHGHGLRAAPGSGEARERKAPCAMGWRTGLGGGASMQIRRPARAAAGKRGGWRARRRSVRPHSPRPQLHTPPSTSSAMEW